MVRCVAMLVAFTLKGGCPLKLDGKKQSRARLHLRSIHPQGWVPIETIQVLYHLYYGLLSVAFTLKGGCPLKLVDNIQRAFQFTTRSIHPQGWVPIETRSVLHPLPKRLSA